MYVLAGGGGAGGPAAAWPDGCWLGSDGIAASTASSGTDSRHFFFTVFL